MSVVKPEGRPDKLERLTRKWWFIALFILLQFFVPPYASKGFDWAETGEVIGHILSNALIYSIPRLYPVFQVIPIILVICLLLFNQKVSRLLSIYAGISYVLFAVLQNISITEQYGPAIVLVNVIMFLLVAAAWFMEAAAGKNDFTPVRRPWWRYWVVPAALLAFWYPLHPVTYGPYFNPAYLFTSCSGLTFCMMTPVYLAILTLYYPKVNLLTLRITSLVGLIIGFYNMQVNFVFIPELLWWSGVLHLPLVALSIYGLVLSLKKTPSAILQG